MKRISIIILLLSCMTLSCKKYLDIVPDNVATIENAFTLRSTAQRYLISCYSFMIKESDVTSSTLLASDEIWLPIDPMPFYEFNADQSWGIALGRQNTNVPLLDYWNEVYGAGGLWKGIRYCNIFLENIMKVPGMSDQEKKQWVAEAKVLKAYYHFYLLKMYGPIPIVKENLPISASTAEVRVKREPVDDVFAYIVQLLDEAAPDLPAVVVDENLELGRITKLVALAMKAKALVYAASPLFNGNKDYPNFGYGSPLFNPVLDNEKWTKAANACQEAITAAEAAGVALYKFEGGSQTAGISEATKTELSLRNAFTEKWNAEIIWANPNSSTTKLQTQATPFALDPAAKANPIPRGNLSATLNVASLYYTKNGVPINEDNEWNYAERFSLRTATDNDKLKIAADYVTSQFNYDREPRFYANLGFDGGVWYGQGKYADNKNDNWVVKAKVGQTQGKQGVTLFPVTGYLIKKYIPYTNVMSPTGSTYSMTDYPWVEFRLADLYLLYAEALNESGSSPSQVFNYLDPIRERAGLPGVQESWSKYSRFPGRITTKEGVREIIQRERSIELMFEGQRFWDQRRWKTAPQTFNVPITGWDSNQENVNNYYRVKVIYNQNFTLRNYFWPIRERDIMDNTLILQTPGW